MVRPMVNSTKHIVQQSLVVVASTTSLTVEVIDTQSGAVSNLANTIREGAIIKAVFFEIWIRGGDDAAGSTYVFQIEKTSGNPVDVTAGQMAALFTYDNKKNILFTSQGLVNDDSSVATPVIREWIKIPKSKQRFGLDDRLKWSLLVQSGGVDLCGLQIFKEYF